MWKLRSKICLNCGKKVSFNPQRFHGLKRSKKSHEVKCVHCSMIQHFEDMEYG